MKRARGFTLLEVLIALAIASLALVALFGAAAATGRNAIVLRDRTFAHWVAANELAELRARDAWPEPGELAGDVTFASRPWHWHALVATTDDADIRRVELRVSADDGSTAGSLVGFLGRPQPPPAPSGGG